MPYKCICISPVPEEGKVIVERCSLKKMIKDLKEVFREMTDTDTINDLETTVVIKRDDGEEFELIEEDFKYAMSYEYPEEESREKSRKIWRELVDFLKGGKVVWFHLVDSSKECCYGPNEYCDFNEMLEHFLEEGYEVEVWEE